MKKERRSLDRYGRYEDHSDRSPLASSGRGARTESADPNAIAMHHNLDPVRARELTDRFSESMASVQAPKQNSDLLVRT
jgi:hypothetical protein